MTRCYCVLDNRDIEQLDNVNKHTGKNKSPDSTFRTQLILSCWFVSLQVLLHVYKCTTKFLLEIYNVLNLIFPLNILCFFTHYIVLENCDFWNSSVDAFLKNTEHVWVLPDLEADRVGFVSWVCQTSFMTLNKQCNLSVSSSVNGSIHCIFAPVWWVDYVW